MTGPRTRWESTHLGPRFGPLARLTGARPVPLTGTLRSEKKALRDLHTIQNSAQLARLQGIGQVFVGSGPGHTSRLAHSREVSELAAEIAAALGLSSPLAAAIGLAHDCGHAPFSHAGERLIAEYFPAFGHAVHGATLLAPLRLSEPTLDGIRNHSWSRPNPATPEAEIVRWVDRIAYLTRDFQDSVELDLVTPRSLPEPILRELGNTREEQIKSLSAAVVRSSRQSGVISMLDGPAKAMATFRSFNLTHFYTAPPVQASATITTAALQQVIRDSLRAKKTKALDHLIELTDFQVLDLAGLPHNSPGMVPPLQAA